VIVIVACSAGAHASKAGPSATAAFRARGRCGGSNAIPCRVRLAVAPEHAVVWRLAEERPPGYGRTCLQEAGI